MALEALVQKAHCHRVILQESPPVGVYVFVFRAGEESPCEDYLQDDWVMAKEQALEDFDVTDEMWREIPDTDYC